MAVGRGGGRGEQRIHSSILLVLAEDLLCVVDACVIKLCPGHLENRV